MGKKNKVTPLPLKRKKESSSKEIRPISTIMAKIFFGDDDPIAKDTGNKENTEIHKAPPKNRPPSK